MRSTAPKMTDGTEKGEKGDRDALGDQAGEVDRCPICLTPPGPRDRAIPESCDHLFCLRCILTWSQTVPSCPVDRRPFSVVYKLDAVLGTVKIPVKQKTNRTELQMCCYGKEREETKSCTSRRRPGEKTPHGNLHTKMKEDSVRKCKSHDSKCNQEASGLRKKKLMDLCGVWFLGPNITSLHPESGSSAILTQCYAELFREDDGDSTVLQKRCRLDLQNWNWLHATAAIPVSGLARISRQPCRPCEMGISALPLRYQSSHSTSATGQQAGHFVFQVEECIITCARGGEKKASRPSSYKGSKNQTENSTARRSSRHSKAEESPPAPAPASPPSHHSGSDSPVFNLSAKQAGASKPEQKPVGKRNSKQKAKQKSGARRRQRRKASQESHSSPEESGPEEPKEEEEQEETDEGSRSNNSRCQNANAKTGTSKQLTDQEGVVISTDNNLQQEVPNLTYTNINLQQEVSCPITTDHNSQEDISCPSTPGNDSEQEVSCPTTPNDDFQQEVKSPITTDESLQGEDVEAKNSVGQENDCNRENDSRGRKTVSDNNDIIPSPVRQEQEEMEDHLKKHSSNKELQKNPEMNASTQEGAEVLPLGEVEDSISSGQKEEVEPERPLENTMLSGCDQPMEEEMDLMEPVIDKEHSEDDATAKTDELNQDSEPNTFSDHSNSDPLRNREPKPSAQPNGNVFDKCSDGLTEPESTQEAKNEESLSDDNTDLVPMECDSPGSERHELQSEQEGESSACAPVPKAPGEKNTSEASSHEEAQDKKETRQRRSRFHSSTTTWSPKTESKMEQQEDDCRSRSKERNTTPPSRRRSRTSSRDRDRGRDNSRSEGSRRNRSRERRSRRRSRSRSRSRSRNRTFGGRGSSSERGESRRQSPRRRERRANDGWRNSWGNEQPRREDQDKLSGPFGKETDDSDKGGLAERLAEKARGQNPEAVREKGDSEVGGSGAVGNSRWEDNCSDNAGDAWAQIVGRGNWNSEGGRGGDRTRGGSREEPSQNRWPSRNAFSGTQNSSGNDSYGRRGELELSETPMDRSGWSTASSRAVRRTLPADVQSYYSRRGRNSAGPGSGWNRQEEETPAQDPPHNETLAVPRGEGAQLPLTAPTQPLAVLQFPMGAHAAPLSLPPPHFGIPPQVPVPIHSAMPHFQGLPPPPPPPPPLQQGDGRPQRAVSSIPVQGGTRFYAPVLPGHPKAAGDIGQPAVPLPSSTTQPTSKDFSKIEVCADSSKKEKKLQIQERAIHEVKTAIKPYYQNKDITKDEYKEIVRKAVEKICHSKSGEVNSGKVANLVKAYVDKYKHARKSKSDVHSKC